MFLKWIIVDYHDLLLFFSILLAKLTRLTEIALLPNLFMDIDRLQKIIESCHLNFLIGSGASRDYLDTLWNIEILLTELDKIADRSSDSYKLLETSIRYWYFDKCMRGNLKLSNHEIALSEPKQSEFEKTVESYSDFVKALNVILLKRKTNLLNKQVNLFTTNMDIFLDIVLDGLGIEFNDGFAGKFKSTFKTSNYQRTVFKSSSQYNLSSELPLFNLFKLHGSLTWSKSSPDEITYDSSLSALKNLDVIDFSNESMISLTMGEGEQLRYKDFEALKTESISTPITDQSKFTHFKDEYEKLVMINPTKEKFENTTLRLEYYEQMRMYSNILEKENSVLFVTGFSFADEHIREITTRALNSNPTLMVFVFCFDQADKLKMHSLFPSLKFNNLYTDYVGYSFHKTANDIFGTIAKNLDAKFYGQIADQKFVFFESNETSSNGNAPQQ
jgi:hypothetical protein